MYSYDYLFFLLIEVFNDDTDEQIQGKEWTEYDKEDEVQVHVNIDFSLGLLVNLLIIKKHQIFAVITVIYISLLIEREQHPQFCQTFVTMPS